MADGPHLYLFEHCTLNAARLHNSCLSSSEYRIANMGFSSMRGDDAKNVCPNIQLIQVPVARGKADLNLYRNAGSEVCWPPKKSFSDFLICVTCIVFPL